MHLSIVNCFIHFCIVSAFYAEHPNKKICCTGHIWTKSKFLGLSIGVEMVGQGATLSINSLIFVKCVRLGYKVFFI